MATQDNPFKATQIWQEVISNFRGGMPCRRRRVKMRFYDDCFTGPEAIQWLHAHLQTTGSFSTVSHHQVKKLLEKFMVSNVIEEVRGRLSTFKEDGPYLYHFVTEPGPFNFVEKENNSPKPKGGSKSEIHFKATGQSLAKTPAATFLGKRKKKEDVSVYDGTWYANEYASTSYDEDNITSKNNKERSLRNSVQPEEENIMVLSPLKKSRRDSSVVPMETDRSLLASPSGGGCIKGKDISPALVAKVWKELTLNRLLILIELSSLDGVLTPDVVDGSHIAHNVASVARMVGGACSSAARTCWAAMGRHSSSGCGSRSSTPLAPVRMMKRRSSSSSSSSSFSHYATRSHTAHLHEHLLTFRSTPSNIFADDVNDLPQQVILAMCCLSKWPESCNEELVGGMPIYSGLELDVFQSLLDYFHSQGRPLIGTALYDLYTSLSSLVERKSKHCLEATQLCCLLLSQACRTKLHRLLKFISKASTNCQLHLSKDQSNWNILLDQFTSAILRRSGKFISFGGGKREGEGVRDLVGFMTQHYQTIFKVPEDLKEEVQERIQQLQGGKGSPLEVKHVYCRQVSAAQYQEEGKANAHRCMTQLLEGILAHPTISNKEKRLKLKMFQKQYPEIYHEKFHNWPHPLTESASRTT